MLSSTAANGDRITTEPPRPEPLSDPPRADRRRAVWLRIAWALAWRLALIALAAWALHLAAGALMARTARMPPPQRDLANAAALAALLVVYAGLIALPFVPGVEIGMALLMSGGAALALPVWGATVAGLMGAFAAGRLWPLARLTRGAEALHLEGLARLIARSAALPPKRRMALLNRRLPGWAAPFCTRWRYVTLALLVALPGNAVLGGGGGLALLAGLSGVFSWRGAVLCFALAVLPVPLGFWVGGRMG